MRKVFYLVAVIALAAVVMPSCSNKEKCWKAKLIAEQDNGNGQTTKKSATIYTWGSEDEVNAVLGDWKEEYSKNHKDEDGWSVKFTMEKYKASDAECEDKSGFKEVDNIERFTGLK